MLQNYLAEWANARKNAVILDEKKNDNGDIMFQRIELVFQGTKIEIRNTRIVEGEVTPNDRFSAEFFVPSTLTRIDAFRMSDYPSTEFIATILEALDPAYARTQKEAIEKRKANMDQYIGTKKQEWLEAFADTKYILPEVEKILAYAENALKYERISSIDNFIQLMVKYQDYILDNTVKITTNSGNEITMMDLMYEFICKACNLNAFLSESRFFVTVKSMEYVILDDSHDDKAPDYIIDVKNIYRAIWDECKCHPAIFTVFAHGLARFYEYKLDETIAYRLARINERKNRNRPFRPGKHAVSVEAMMSNISSAFDAAKPLKTKKSKKG